VSGQSVSGADWSDGELDGQLIADRPDDGQYELTRGKLRRRRRLTGCLLPAQRGLTAIQPVAQTPLVRFAVDLLRTCRGHFDLLYEKLYNRFTTSPQSNLRRAASQMLHWLQWDAPNSPQNCPYPSTITTPIKYTHPSTDPTHHPKRHPDPFSRYTQTDTQIVQANVP